jgi:hypothetical protein
LIWRLFWILVWTLIALGFAFHALLLLSMQSA